MFKKHGLKLALVSIAIIVAIVCGIMIVSILQTKGAISQIINKQAQGANVGVQKDIEAMGESAKERAGMMALSKSLLKAVETNDKASFEQAMQAYGAGVDIVTITDAEGKVIYRMHNGEIGDSAIKLQVIETALTKDTNSSSIQVDAEAKMSALGGAPIHNASGKTIGAVAVGFDLSLESHVKTLSEDNNCEITIFAGNTRINTTITDKNGAKSLGTQADQNITDQVFNKGQVFQNDIVFLEQKLAAYYAPIKNEGKIVGILFTGANIDGIRAQQNFLVFLVSLGIVLLIVTVLITALIIKWITGKMYWYEAILDHIPFPVSVTDNDMNWTFVNKPIEEMLKSNRADLIGKPCKNWGSGICGTEDCGIECLKRGAHETYYSLDDSEYKVDVHFLSDQKGKQIGQIEIVQDVSAMQKIIKAQEGLIKEIQQASQVFVDASQTSAAGAQTLAQGTTEQASEIDNLNISIEKMLTETKENVKMADQAANLVTQIKNHAENGTEKMNEMVKAVNDISSSSQNISNVIKKIEDIAFQTNILALNASVEAARAGAQNNGFTVVAREVGQLAAKSAAAAKDSAALIEESIEKAALGVKISEKTSESLAEIVEGVNQSVTLIENIAKLSEQQSESIDAITLGINEITEVVQSNSASAEESAATAQEISSQANLLKSLVSKESDSE